MARSRSPRRFQCEWEGCGKSFEWAPHLARHVRTVHEGLKPFACDLCQTTFGIKYDLDVHVCIVHEGLSPFQCDICCATFGKTGHLGRHIRCVHEGLTPCGCDICFATFGQQAHLDDHMRCVHEGLRPFACDLCDATVGRRHGLKAHTRQIHSAKALKRVKNREEQTRNALSDNGFTSDRELRNKFSSRAECPCSARVDFTVLRSWGCVYLEVDERQHQG